MTLNLKQIPRDIRQLIRNEDITTQTSGMCMGYAQANLIILPKDYAEEFKEFAALNPKPCPILEICDTPYTKIIADNANILTDIPRYYIYRYGEKADESLSAIKYYEELGDGAVGFLIGCSFSFEEALIKGGLEIRHITEGRNVPMYRTNIDCAPYGRMRGKLVVSMRPFSKDNIDKAYEITSRFPKVHGSPVHYGDPSKIGINDINSPDYGDSVSIYDDEIPVFWACGVTPQSIIMQAKPPLAISHAPGHMFISDITNESLASTAI